jgi:hypothetical protein
MAKPRAQTIICDVGSVVSPDLGTVNALARLALTVRRLGLELELRHVSAELRALLAFTGVLDVLIVESGGETEQWEQGVGVEEERHLDDPAA